MIISSSQCNTSCATIFSFSFPFLIIVQFSDLLVNQLRDNRNSLGRIVGLVDTNKFICELEHIVAQ